VADVVWAWGDPECAPLERAQLLHVDIPADAENPVERIAAVLLDHPGADNVLIHLRVDGRRVTVQAGERYRVAAGPALSQELDSIFGRPVTRLETVRPVKPANGNGNGYGRSR
jgi:hypothetical protein